jgi:hypothetical protein
MVSKDGARKKTISTIAVVGILVTISLAYFIPGIHPGHIVNYSEKTLFLGNNTLINDSFPQQNPNVQIGEPTYIVLDSSHNLIATENLSNIFVVNAGTNRVVKSIQYNPFYQPYTTQPIPQTTPIFYNPEDGDIFFENYLLNETQMINGSSLQVSNFSGILNAFPSLYDPFNHYFYGASSTNYSIHVMNSSFSTITTIPVEGLALFFQHDLAYDPANHDVYALTTSLERHEAHYNITVIDPGNRIIATIPSPAKSEIYITYFPAYHSMFVNNYTAVAELNDSGGGTTFGNFPNGNAFISAICMNGTSNYILVLGNRLSVLYNKTQYLGNIPSSYPRGFISSSPDYGVYDQVTHRYYITNEFAPDELTVLNVWLTTTPISFSWYNPLAILNK